MNNKCRPWHRGPEKVCTDYFNVDEKEHGLNYEPLTNLNSV